jgi:hypothetical protein
VAAWAGAGPPYESRYWGRDLKIVCVEKANVERSGSDARSGTGLGEMTRRKREIAGFANEQDFPHLVSHFRREAFAVFP